MKRSRRHLQHARRRHADVSRALDAIVGVQCAQGGVDRAHEALAVARRPVELDDPVVAAAGIRCRRIPRRHGELGHLGAVRVARAHHRLLDLLDDDVLAERVHEVTHAPGDDEAQWIAGGEAHGIAQDVRPESGRCRQQDGVTAVELDVGHGVTARPAEPEILDRDELVEDAVVEHQREAARRLRLHGDEPLGRGIDLDAIEPAAQALLEAQAIRREGHATVDEHGEIRPAVRDVRVQPADFVEEDQEPRRHARQQAEILSSDAPSGRRQPGLPVGNRRHVETR